VIGHARSADMINWELAPPISVPAGFGQIEVPQARIVDGRPTLVFTCHTDEQTPQRKRQAGMFCTWSVPGDSLTGPWDVSRAAPFEAEPNLFAAPFVQDRSGGWVLVGFLNPEPKGINSFDIIDPIPVTLRDGVLVAAAGCESVGEALLARKAESRSMV